MNTKTTIAIVAVVAITAMLLASTLSPDALAGKCKSKKWNWRHGNDGGHRGGFSSNVNQVISQATNDGGNNNAVQINGGGGANAVAIAN